MGLDYRLSEFSRGLDDVAVGNREWVGALAELAALTGAKSGELIGFGETRFQIISNVSHEELDRFVAARGHDPRINSRVRVGLQAPEMVVLDENSFATREDCARHPEYGAMLSEIDIPYACLSVLERNPNSVVGLTLLSSARSGPMSAQGKRILTAALPHILSTVRFQRALEGRAIQLAMSTFEHSEAAAFVIDKGLTVRSITSRAETLVRCGDFRLSRGRLHLPGPDDAAFQAALSAALRSRDLNNRPCGSIRARTSEGLAYLVEIAPLPSTHGFNFEAGVVVVARPPKANEARAARTAAALFGLTPAEAAIAGLLSLGLSAAMIAERQGTSIGTVRTHIRRILDKSAARNQTDFVAALMTLL